MKTKDKRRRGMPNENEDRKLIHFVFWQMNLAIVKIIFSHKI